LRNFFEFDHLPAHQGHGSDLRWFLTSARRSGSLRFRSPDDGKVIVAKDKRITAKHIRDIALRQ
jgi:hypothetical protein